MDGQLDAKTLIPLLKRLSRLALQCCEELEESVSLEALAAQEPDAKPHPASGLMVSPKGCVLLVKRSHAKAGWTYGSPTAAGYRVVYTLGRMFYVHRLVAETFIGAALKDRPCVDHIDHNRANNAVSNLHWVSIAENNQNRSDSIRPLILANPKAHCNTTYRRALGAKLGVLPPQPKRPRGHFGHYEQLLEQAPRAADGLPILAARYRRNTSLQKYLRAHGLKAHYESDRASRKVDI